MSAQRPSNAAKTGRPPARPSQQRRRPKRRGRQSRKPLLAVVGAVVLAAAVVIAVVATKGSSPKPSGPIGPEGATLEQGAVLAAASTAAPTGGNLAGVGCGATEQLATHTHTHLAVYVNGTPRPIPAGVGMVGQLQSQAAPSGTFVSGASDCLYWLHTHAEDGILHVEAPAGRTFVLGQFFAIWGQPLTSAQVGSASGQVTAYVDGHLWTQAIQNIPLAGHSSIQLDVGTPLVPPKKVVFPSSL